MKRVILFFGSFDPLHKGHIDIVKKATKLVDADLVFFGLNKSSKKGRLTSLKIRRAMLNNYIKNNKKYKLVDFPFDYNNLDDTYNRIFALINEDDENYILIGEDQLKNLTSWYEFNLLKKKFKFIVAKRDDSKFDYKIDAKYLYLNHKYTDISSTNIKKGNYKDLDKATLDYILKHNLYLKKHVHSFISGRRYMHTLSVAKTALKINKECHLGLDKYVVERAALLHDIAKHLSRKQEYYLMHKYYPNYVDEKEKLYHQYLGVYLAKKYFYETNNDILNAIMYHTTGRANMSTLEKLIFIADKIEPTRKYHSLAAISKEVYKDFEKGFIAILENKKKYLETAKVDVTNKTTFECYKYYLN